VCGRARCGYTFVHSLLRAAASSRSRPAYSSCLARSQEERRGALLPDTRPPLPNHVPLQLQGRGQRPNQLPLPSPPTLCHPHHWRSQTPHSRHEGGRETHMPRSCCCLIACLTVTAAFTPAPASTTLCGRVSSSTLHGRSSKLSAHLLHGWTPKVDQASGATYFFNTQTGVTQWEPPTAATAQQSFGTQVCYILAPAAGAFNAYTVYNDQEQVLGYHDMIWQNPYIPDAQCVVRVSNGEASLFSLGDTSTALRVPGGSGTFSKRARRTSWLTGSKSPWIARGCTFARAHSLLKARLRPSSPSIRSRMTVLRSRAAIGSNKAAATSTRAVTSSRGGTHMYMNRCPDVL
jgi:hypothetical protein